MLNTTIVPATVRECCQLCGARATVAVSWVNSQDGVTRRTPVCSIPHEPSFDVLAQLRAAAEVPRSTAAAR